MSLERAALNHVHTTVANVTHVRAMSGFGKRQFTVVCLQNGKESRTFICAKGYVISFFNNIITPNLI